MNSTTTNNNLFDQFKNGDIKSFAKYYDRYYGPALSFANRYLKDDCLAEDAVQTLFVKLWEQKGMINSSETLSNYLFTILKHIVLDLLKHKATIYLKHEEIKQASMGWVSESITKELEEKEVSENLGAAISRLSPQKQRICRLKIYNGYSNQEIADELDISINTVKVQYTQLIKELRFHMKEYAGLLFLLWILTLK